MGGQDAIKLTYKHFLFQIFPEMVPPDPRQKGEGAEGGVRGEGKERDRLHHGCQTQLLAIFTF